MFITVKDIDAKSIEEVIKICGKEMSTLGFVNEEYTISCLKREKEFPTGIDVFPPVSMPHTFEGVNKSFLCLLRNKANVEVFKMDDPNNSIQTKLIFCMGIVKGEDKYLDFLGNLIRLFQDNESMQYIENEIDINKIENILNMKLLEQ